MTKIERGEWVEEDFKYVNTYIASKKITQDPEFKCPSKPDVNNVTQALFDFSICKTEQARLTALNKAAEEYNANLQNIKVGDDFSMVAIQLKPIVLQTYYEEHLKDLELPEDLGNLPKTINAQLALLPGLIQTAINDDAKDIIQSIEELLTGPAADLFETDAVINQETIAESRDAIKKYNKRVEKLPQPLTDVLNQISVSLEPTRLASHHIREQIANLTIGNADESLTKKPIEAFQTALNERFQESLSNKPDSMLDEEFVLLFHKFSSINRITQNLMDALTPFLNKQPNEQVSYQAIIDARLALIAFSNFLPTLSLGDKLVIAAVALIGVLAGIVGGFFAGLSIADHVVSSGGEQLISVFDQVIKALSSFDLRTMFEAIGNAGTEAIAITASGAAAGAILVGAGASYCGYRGLFSPAQLAARNLANAVEEVIAKEEKNQMITSCTS